MKPMLLLVMFLASTAAHAALGPTSPPPGFDAATWKEIAARASKAAKMAVKHEENANEECLKAVFLRILANSEIAASASGEFKVTVEPQKADAIRKSLDKNMRDNCPDGDKGVTMSAAVKFVSETPDWDTGKLGGRTRAEMHAALRDLYDIARPSMLPDSRVVQGLLSLGVLVPATSGSVAAPAGLPLPIFNTKLFTPNLIKPEEPRPDEGT